MEHQNIQPFILKSGDSVNDYPNDNGPNSKLKSLCNDVKSTWMLKYGTKQILPHCIKPILVVAWDAFKVTDRKFIRKSFVKTKLPPLLSPTNLTANIQACAASVQISSVSKAE